MNFRFVLYIPFCLILLTCASSPTSDENVPSLKKEESPKKGFNWIILEFTEDEWSTVQSILPFYTFEEDKKEQSEDFTLWPLISGYKRQKDRLYWFSFPLLTQHLSIEDPQRSIQHFISIPLITRYETYYVRDDFSFQRFDSLPLLTSIFSQIRPAKKEKFFTLGTPFFQTWTLEQKNPLTRLKSWSIGPSFLSDTHDFAVLKRQQWEEETDLSIAEIFNISLFRHERYQSRFPGSRYAFSPSQYMSLSSEESLLRFSEPETSWKTKTSFLNPFFSLKFEASEFRQAELLPLFSYQQDSEHWSFSLTPLFLSLDSSKIVDFTPRKSMESFFPLVWFEPERNQWNGLASFFFYRKDRTREETQIRLRGIFEFDQNTRQTNFNLGEGTLFSYHSDLNYERWSFLTGFLFGRSTEPDGKYIEFLFFKIKTEDFSGK
ncbi:MAG: hypothetical protein AABZ60_14975 [Planctomycetota bacterium]